MKVDLFKDLKGLRVDIDEREKELKELKKDYDSTMQMCVDNMLENNLDSVKVDGTLFTLDVKERPSVSKEKQKGFYGYLRRHGFGGIIVTKKAINYQTLGKWYREFIKENPNKGKILSRYLNVFTDKKIIFRGLKK